MTPLESPTPTPMIDLRRVVKTFTNAAGSFDALRGVDLRLLPGEFVSIVGRSGSGKSTLLNMITGIDFPTSGEVLVGGADIYRLSESQRALWRGRNVGIVFQFFQLLPMLTLLENVMLPMDYVGAYDFDERPARAWELLERVGLHDHAHSLPASVSIGQQQGAAIARALATDPPLIVADEPTGNLDSRSAAVIIELFDGLASQGKTIAMVTHDPSLTERTSRTVIISDGELVDESIARAFPRLGHRQMLQTTRQLERLSFQPNATIVSQGESVGSLFVIEHGCVEVVLLGRRRGDVTIARLCPGDYFGEIELLRGGKSIASIRAAPDGPVDLLALRPEAFRQLLADSPLTAESLTATVEARLRENRAVDRRRARRPEARP
jgi:ABC-type lipoprotein export system ATPase subunit